MDEYQDIRREYCNLMKWHPVYGDYEKPVNLSFSAFTQHQKRFGIDWTSWEVYDKAVPSQEEMIFELEFLFGNLNYLPSKSIRLDEPVLRVAKSKTKNGNYTLVRQYHIPPGNPFDKRITRTRARQAYLLIQKGKPVSKALKESGVRYDALLRHTPYIPIRRDLRMQKIQEATKLIKDGWKLKDDLSHLQMSSKTFSRWAGNKKIILETNDFTSSPL